MNPETHQTTKNEENRSDKNNEVLNAEQTTEKEINITTSKNNTESLPDQDKKNNQLLNPSSHLSNCTSPSSSLLRTKLKTSEKTSSMSFHSNKEKSLYSLMKAKLICQDGAIGLTMNSRPECLPAKSKEEIELHKALYKKLLNNSKKTIEREAKVLANYAAKNALKERELAKDIKHWNQIIDNWDDTLMNKNIRSLWEKGIPSNIRNKVWKLCTENQMTVDREVFNELMKTSKMYMEEDEKTLIPKEIIEVVSSIKLDAKRTFPALKIFQEAGPLNQDLCLLLCSYSLYNTRLSYVQGMAYFMAIFLLNLEPFFAFVCFNNLMNTPLINAFFSFSYEKICEIFVWYETFLCYNHSALVSHLKNIFLTSELYLYDWIMTGFCKIFNLDTINWIFDLYLRDGSIIFMQIAFILVYHHGDLIQQEKDKIKCCKILLSSQEQLTSHDLIVKKLDLVDFNDYYKELIRYLKFT